MSAAASKLHQSEAPIGQAEAWSNPNSGSSGTVTLLQRFQKGDMPCQKIRHAFLDKSANSSVFDINVCRVAPGEWKIAF